MDRRGFLKRLLAVAGAMVAGPAALLSERSKAKSIADEIADQICSVQPMTAPIKPGIYFLEYDISKYRPTDDLCRFEPKDDSDE
jgi:hypothetical protein